MKQEHSSKQDRYLGQRYAMATAALFLFACGDTLQIYPDGTSSGGRQDQAAKTRDGGADGSTTDAGAGVDASRSSTQVIHACQPDVQNSGATTGDACDFANGCAVDGGATCGKTYAFCAFGALALTELTLLGCNDSGLDGNPASTVSSCTEALDGPSGASCGGAGFLCGRTTDDSCCVQLAECESSGDPAATVRVARVCVPHCERYPLQKGSEIASCDDLVRAGHAESLSMLHDLRGRGCSGAFVCGSDGENLVGSLPGGGLNSYGEAFFCGAGRLQVTTLGSSSLLQP